MNGINYKITREVEAIIDGMVRDLPQISTGIAVPTFKQVSGDSLIRQYRADNPESDKPLYIVIEGKDVKVRPNKKYLITVSETQLVNHKVELIKCWKRGSAEACRDYVMRVKQDYANLNKKALGEKLSEIPGEDYGEVEDDYTMPNPSIASEDSK